MSASPRSDRWLQLPQETRDQLLGCARELADAQRVLMLSKRQRGATAVNVPDEAQHARFAIATAANHNDITSAQQHRTVCFHRFLTAIYDTLGVGLPNMPAAAGTARIDGLSDRDTAVHAHWKALQNFGNTGRDKKLFNAINDLMGDANAALSEQKKWARQGREANKPLFAREGDSHSR